METNKKNILKAYFRWPFYLGALLLLQTIACFFAETTLGFYMLGITVLYYLSSFIIHLFYRNTIIRKLVSFGAEYAQVQNRLLKNIDIPIALCNGDGEIFWYNQSFGKTFGIRKKSGMLSVIFPMMENADFETENEYHVEHLKRKYELRVNEFNLQDVESMGELSDYDSDRFYSMLFLDETEKIYYSETLEEERAVAALVYIDNYDEVMENMESLRMSLLMALVEKKLNQYISDVQGIIRKLEKDRFFVVLKQEALWKLQEEDFSILDTIKTVTITNTMPVTLSIGIGSGGDTLQKNYEYAQAAIDMALGRGGDQTVLKDGSEIICYGGKSESVENNTRVKARIKAQALREIIEGKDKVLIMGHPIGDLDCVGAAMGIYRAAKFSGKRAYIVLSTVSRSIKPVTEKLRISEEYENDLFINGEKALEICGKDTLIVVVDTNKPSYTDCPELLKAGARIVVMDHHRQGVERIENAVLSYVEPSASSASEMVAEMVQYYDSNLRLKPLEAEALLAGIVMDTNNFTDKTGSRTFEAAAYLKNNGADVTSVRRLFREPMADYILKAETIKNAVVYRENYIIGICPSDIPNENQTVVSAQCANGLLEIEGIKASFVLTEYKGKIYLSARSIGDINVQLICEKLGGGGHRTIAGAQLNGITVDEALKTLKSLIDEELNDKGRNQ